MVSSIWFGCQAGLQGALRAPAVHVPTLVIQRTGDLDVKLAEGRCIANHIDGARFVELP
jgi:hypothetical protein